MAPVTTNRSVRLQNDLWSWITEEAERRGVTVNGLIADLLMVARLKSEERAAGPTCDDGPMLHVNTSAATPKLNIQIGPIERKPGSMLKGPKK